MEDRLKVFIGRRRIRKRVKELAKELSEEYRGKIPLFIGVLKGAFVFLSDLVRFMEIPVNVDFVWISSYGPAMESSGNIHFIAGPSSKVGGRDVVIVEDIVDTGLSLSWLLERMREMNASSVKTCVLLDKKSRRRVPFEADFVGFDIPDRFVVGYGIDYNEKYRDLEDICYIVED